MPQVWDILHASMNAEGEQLTWCCIIGERGRGFLKKILMKFFFFFFEKFGNLEFFQGIENFDWWFFFFWKQPKKYEPNAPSPKALFENFLLFFFFFGKELERIDFFFFFFEIWRFVHYQKEGEDEDGVKVMKIYSWWFFFFFLKNLSFEWE